MAVHTLHPEIPKVPHKCLAFKMIKQTTFLLYYLLSRSMVCLSIISKEPEPDQTRCLYRFTRDRPGVIRILKPGQLPGDVINRQHLVTGQDPHFTFFTRFSHFINTGRQPFGSRIYQIILKFGHQNQMSLSLLFKHKSPCLTTDLSLASQALVFTTSYMPTPTGAPLSNPTACHCPPLSKQAMLGQGLHLAAPGQGAGHVVQGHNITLHSRHSNFVLKASLS